MSMYRAIIDCTEQEAFEATVAMFARAKRFVQRNFPNIVLGVMAVPVFYRLTRYASRHYLLYRRRRTHELVQKFKKQQMFELMEEGFEKTFRTYFDIMKETIKETLNVEKFADLVKSGGGDKLKNWKELKIVAFSSIISYIYASSILTVLLRIQVNVISGLLFKQMENTPANLEVMDGGAGDASVEFENRKVSDELQNKYMVLTQHFCTEGVAALCRLMNEKCREIVGNISLKQKLSVADIEQLFVAIRNKEIKGLDGIEDCCPITQTWNYIFSEELKRQYLYPPGSFSKPLKDDREAFLRQLIGEAYDLIGLEDTKNVLKFLEAQGINFYLDRISEYLTTTVPPPATNYSDIVPPEIPESIRAALDQAAAAVVEEREAPVAKLIPVMNGFINVPYTEDLWATLLVSNDTLKSFSANIYESYSSKQFVVEKNEYI